MGTSLLPMVASSEDLPENLPDYNVNIYNKIQKPWFIYAHSDFMSRLFEWSGQRIASAFSSTVFQLNSRL